MAIDAGGESRCGVGARLRTARERAGLSLLQAAEKLHVDASVLEALESENFEVLGASVFVRGHIRRYAELVQEPAADLQALYSGSSQVAPPPDLTRIPKSVRSAHRQALLVPGLTIVIAIAVIGTVWWVVTSTEEGVVSTPIPEAEQTPVATAPVPVPAASASSSAPATASPEPPPAVTNAAAPRRSEPPPIIALALHFAADSWVEVYDAAGARLLYDVGAAGSARSVSGEAPLRVVLGNAPGVSVEVNGREAALPGRPRADGTAQFFVSRSGRLVRSRAAAAE